MLYVVLKVITYGLTSLYFVLQFLNKFFKKQSSSFLSDLFLNLDLTKSDIAQVKDQIDRLRKSTDMLINEVAKIQKSTSED